MLNYLLLYVIVLANRGIWYRPRPTSTSRERHDCLWDLPVTFFWGGRRHLPSALRGRLRFGQGCQAQPGLPQKMPHGWSSFPTNLLPRHLEPQDGPSLLSEPQVPWEFSPCPHLSLKACLFQDELFKRL
uniref:Uncharacterized protein n=1 Tax=Rousettus aegyptiacus TaxID=9407 RepID=A0A7J8C2N6_ROUAE|nr:hypothetical protein HJG63_009426 [Rousettus aegyptiacus]